MHVASFNDAPKQDRQKLRQTNETISLLKKATNTIEKGTVALGLRSASSLEQDQTEAEEPEEKFHRIEVVSEDDSQVPIRELIVPKDANTPQDCIEMDEIPRSESPEL